MTKIAIVDDHHLVRDGLIETFNKIENVQIVFDTDDGIILLEYLKNNPNIDLIVLDLQMNKMGGIEICKEIKTYYPNIKILVLTQLVNELSISSLIKAGANGYCSKLINPKDIEIAIKKIMNNEMYFDSTIKAILPELSEYKSTFKISTFNYYNLSDREIEIIRLISQQKDNDYISKKLGISTRTVENHRRRIIQKTNQKNITDVVTLTIKNQIIKIEEL
ncbi:response regulator [Flavobacterium sp.]|uniref:response regulator n=1 Tax=Flavobacterium sp. TaxID=239 RepID=UPI0038D1D5B4